MPVTATHRCAIIAILTLCLGMPGRAASPAPTDVGEPTATDKTTAGTDLRHRGDQRNFDQPQLSAADLLELHRLRRDDPQAFRRRIRQLLRERQAQVQPAPEEQRLRELVRSYRQTGDETTRAELRTRIAAALRAAFQEQTERNRQRIEQLRARLADLENRCREREQRVEQIIAEQLHAATDNNPAPDSTGDR